MKKKPDAVIELPPLRLKVLEVKVIGDSPLICHRWSEKARRAMLDKQMKKAAQAKQAKDPNQDFLDTLYHHPDGGYGFPAIAFKSAAVDAASFADGVTKVQMRGAMHIDCELVKISGTPTIREDMVRIAMGTADIRHRAEFKQWSSEFAVKFNEGVLTAEQILNLFELAGFSVGVGEWRPQKNGSMGRFHVAREGE